MDSLATNKTLPWEVPSSLPLRSPTLVAVTVPPLALLALVKLLPILPLLAPMAIWTLMALTETSMSLSVVP